MPIELEAQHRTLLGKKVRALRREGFTPVNLYGKGLESVALQVPSVELHHLLRAAHRNDVLTLKVVSEKPRGRAAHHDVLIREVQHDPLNGQVLHVNLFKVSTTDAIRAEVNVILVGESPAVIAKAATLLHSQSILHVSGLAADLPSAIEVDVSSLEEISQVIRVKDVELPAGITLLSDPETVLATLVPVRDFVAEEAAAAAAEAEAEAPAAEEGAEEAAESPTAEGHEQPSAEAGAESEAQAEEQATGRHRR